MPLEKCADDTYVLTLPKEEIDLDSSELLARYADALFLTDPDTRHAILSHSNHFFDLSRKGLKDGDKIIVEGMFLRPGVPLEVRASRCERESDAQPGWLTPRRLLGLVAARAARCEPRPVLVPHADQLGLVWAEDEHARMLCLAAVPGAELFLEQLSVYPLVCALRKYQLHHMSEADLRRLARRKTAAGRSVFHAFQDSYPDPGLFNKYFKKTRFEFNIQAVIDSVPNLGHY